MEISKEKQQIQQQRREELRKRKPKVVEKFLKYDEKKANGEPTPIIEVIYDHKCNMQCRHCMNSRYAKKERAITVSDMKRLADEADQMGCAQFSISGGEPLLFDDFDEIIKAIGADRFHISISTNGFFMTKEKAKHLREIGVDKVKISVDSIDIDTYIQTRGDKQFYQKTFEALENAKEAGLQVVAQTVISHQTCRTPETEKLAAFCQENGFNLDLMVAKPIGEWEGRFDVVIDREDAAYLVELSKKYPVVHRDVFPTYGEKCGRCGMMDKLIEITKYGDILPCGYVQIAIGNIFEDTLMEAIQRGKKVKPLTNNGDLCPSGENMEFIKKYIAKTYGKAIPVSYKEIFTEDEDYYENI